MSESYNPVLFVGRNNPLRDILTWINAARNPHRILSVLGSPGIGKSWLMGSLCDQLRTSGQLVFLLNLGNVSLLKNPTYPSFLLRGKTDFQNNSEYMDWLCEAIEEVRIHCKHCKNVQKCDRTLAPETVLSILLDDLCARCHPPCSPLLIVDGYEEISLDTRRWLEAHFILPYLSRTCTMMILTRRDPWAVQRLRLFPQKDLRLEAFSSHEGQEQIAKRSANLQVLGVEAAFAQLCTFIPSYQKNHPRINRELFEIARERLSSGATLTLNEEDIRGILTKVILPIVITDSALKRLQQIAGTFNGEAGTISGEFSTQELQEKLKIPLHDVALHELFELGILLDNPPRYKIAEGIYELAKAVANLAG